MPSYTATDVQDTRMKVAAETQANDVTLLGAHFQEVMARSVDCVAIAIRHTKCDSAVGLRQLGEHRFTECAHWWCGLMRLDELSLDELVKPDRTTASAVNMETIKLLVFIWKLWTEWTVLGRQLYYYVLTVIFWRKTL